MKNIADTLYVIGGKWTLPVLNAIYTGHHHFSDIQRTLRISTNTLSKELKLLEINFLISRNNIDGISIEYNITNYAHTLIPILSSLKKWGEHHRVYLKEQSLKEHSQN